MSTGDDDALLARLLAEEQGEAPLALGMAKAIPRRPAGVEVPLSFAQQRLWFLDRLVPGNAAYNVSAAFCLSGELDTVALERSARRVVERHEILRTVFTEDVHGRPRQRVLAAADKALEVVRADLSGDPDPLTKARRAADEEAARPFDLKSGPLVRVQILRLAAREHAVIFTLHHMISDGWSTGVLIREMGACYAAEVAGRPAAHGLPDLVIQFGDFAHWQRERLAAGGLEEPLAWWRSELANLPRLELPTDGVRPTVQGFRGKRVPFATDAALRDQLHTLARAQGVTLFATLLGAVEVALGAWSGQQDFAVGAPVAGRTRGELEPLIGFFVNTLVLRSDLPAARTFHDLLARKRQRVQAALAHQDVSFERLVEALNPERELGTTPLVQAVFSLENAPDGGLALPGLTLTPLEPEEVVAKFDLTIALTDSPTGLSGSIDYAEDLFQRGGVERFARLLSRVLQRAVTEPDALLARLVAPDENERGMLQRWGTGERLDYDATKPVPTLLAERVAETPGAKAVVDDTEALTYAELWSRAGRWAAGLRARGVVAGDVVAVCLERSVALVVAELAIWRAGAAYLPLDPAHPVARLQGMAEDAQARCVITAAEVPLALRCSPGELADGTAGLGDDEPGPAADALAYVIFTSGSTGRPKGVAVTHRALLNLVHWHRHAFALAPQDRTTVVAGVAFDAAVWETWPTLAAGGCLHVLPPEVVADPERLRDRLVAERITVSFAPTPLAERLLGLSWPDQVALRVLLAGGDRLRKAPPPGLPFALSNNYGPTEHAVVATSGIIPAGSGELPSIGRPIANTELWLGDANLDPVPVGAIGEICLGGPSLAREYFGRPEHTAERFVATSLIRSGRCYRTGDLARWREDGTLEFRGRADQQVKIRGQRIELGEIEAALLELPRVTEATVEVRDWQGEPTLVAFVAPPCAEQALREALRTRLPAAMVPTIFVGLAALPVTPNGKVDRRALPDPIETRTAAEAAGVAPASDLEVTIAGVWQAALGREAVGVTDNFFDLGGHSLLLVDVQKRLQTVLDRPIAVVDLFAHPTVRSLAQSLQPAEAASAATTATDRAARQRAALARRRAGRREAS